MKDNKIIMDEIIRIEEMRIDKSIEEDLYTRENDLIYFNDGVVEEKNIEKQVKEIDEVLNKYEEKVYAVRLRVKESETDLIIVLNNNDDMVMNFTEFETFRVNTSAEIIGYYLTYEDYEGNEGDDLSLCEALTPGESKKRTNEEVENIVKNILFDKDGIMEITDNDYMFVDNFTLAIYDYINVLRGNYKLEVINGDE